MFFRCDDEQLVPTSYTHPMFYHDLGAAFYILRHFFHILCYRLFPRATSQAGMPACTFGDCRGVFDFMVPAGSCLLEYDHVADLECQHDSGYDHLILDNSPTVLHVQDSYRNNVKISCHRRT